MVNSSVLTQRRTAGRPGAPYGAPRTREGRTGATFRAGRSGRVVARVMADVAGGHDENDVFRDVRRMVADALEMPRDEDQIEGGLDGRRVLEHVRQQLPEDLGLERVEPVVFVEHVLCERDIAAHERVERV